MMHKIRYTVSLFLVSLFTAGVMVAGQSLAHQHDPYLSKCTQGFDLENMTQEQIDEIYNTGG